MEISNFNDYKEAIVSKDYETIINANIYIKENYKETESVEEFFEKIGMGGYKYFLEHQKLFKRKEFNWEIAVDQISSMRKITKYDKMTVKKNEQQMPWTLVNPRLYQKAFPLELIGEYCKRPNYMFGTPIYDKALRLQCDLLQIFLIFHLKSDFRYHGKMTASKYKIIDPVTRIKIRELNRLDEDLKKKYMNPDFDLKEFVFKLYDDFFPNVTWRYIGANHFAHRITLQITEFMFQIGLWTYEDHERLVKVLLEKSENLIRLEQACCKDAQRLSQSFNSEMRDLFTDTKEYMSSIILHIIVLVNDKSLQESLSWKRQSKGLFINSRKELWNNAYYKDRELNHLINNILMKYLMRESVAKKGATVYKYMGEETKENFKNIFMMLTEVDYDPYQISKQLVCQELMDYHTDQLANIMKIREEAMEIKMNLVSFFEDLLNGHFGVYEAMVSEKKMNKALMFLCDWINTYLTEGGPGELYYRQLALGENNIVTLILALSQLLDDMDVQDKIMCLRVLLSKMSQICKDNHNTQAQLFQEQGLKNFQNLNKGRPLMGAIITTGIFETNNQILYVNPESFETIFKFYTDKISEADECFSLEDIKADLKGAINNILALDNFNKYFEKLVDIHNVDTNQRRPYYDLIIQETIVKLITEKVIPILSDPDFLPTNTEGKLKNIDQYLYSFTLVEKNLSDTEILSLAQQENHSDIVLKGLIFDICTSFLRLFNKVTSRMIYGSTYESVKGLVKDSDFQQYSYLHNFKEGSFLKIEVLRFFLNFNIFFSNHLITDRLVHNKHGRVLYLESIIPKSHISTSGGGLIIQELERIDDLLVWYEFSDPWLRKKLKTYFFKGLFPMIYKFVKGISSLFYVDNKLKNASDLPKLKACIFKLYDKLRDQSQDISKLIEKRFLVQTEFFDTHENVSNDLQIEGSKANKNHQRYENMDQEEVFYPDLYEMRKKGEAILHMIEEVYPEDLAYILIKYSRISANKRSPKPTKISEVMKKNNYSNQFTKNREFRNENEEEDITNAFYKEFVEVSKTYEVDKENWITKRGRENLLIGYLNENVGQIGNCLMFIFRAIFEAFEKGEKEGATTEVKTDFIMTKFFQTKYVYPFIIFLDKLITDDEKIKMVMYYMVHEGEDDPYGIAAKGKKICEKWGNITNLVTERKAEIKTVLSIIYFLFTEFGQFCMFKTFIDEDWKEIWTKYYTMGTFIKNLCENNAVYFKRYLSEFKPSLKSAGSFNKAKRNMIFDMYVRLESFTNNYLSWYITNDRLVMADRPELYICAIRHFEIVTEFVNGPCPYNQRLIYKYRTDIWMGTIRRTVNDVNSVFYVLKEKTLDYVQGLIEGEGYFPLRDDVPDKDKKYLCTQYMASNITPREVFSLMFKMMKRLTLYRMMENNPKFRASLIRKIQKMREKEFKRQLKQGSKTAEDIIIERAKFKASDEMFSQYEDPNAVITEEMMDAYEFDHYYEVYHLYKRDTVFANHPIIRLTLKLYSFVEDLSMHSKSFATAVQTNKMKISKFYGEEVDLDDKAKISSKENLVKVSSKLPEELIFLMFILKISKKIEISVKLPTEDSSITKNVFFPILPSALYLEEKTKRDTLDIVNLDKRREEFQLMFQEFFIEMENNYNFSLNNRLLYLMSKNDTLNFQKYLCYVIGILINAFVFVFSELDNNAEPDNRKLIMSRFESILEIMSYAFSAYSGINFILWLAFRGPNQSRVQEIRFRKRCPHENPRKLKNRVYINIYQTFLSNESAQNLLFHCIFAVLGVLLNPVFHTFHLLLIINISPTAKYVLKASTAHLDQLFATLVMAFFLIYSFSVLNSDYFSASFDEGAVNNIDICRTLRSCTLYILNMGLRNGGGIGDSSKLYSLDNAKVYFKTVFDLLFFFTINVISLNIVFGIIIDTFSEIRESNEERSKPNP